MQTINFLEKWNKHINQHYKMSERSINNVRLIGKVADIVAKDDRISIKLGDDTVLIMLDVYFILCEDKNNDVFGTDVNHAYETEGTMLAAASRHNVGEYLGKFVEVTNGVGNGVNIRRQNLTNKNEGFSAFAMRKPNNEYKIIPNTLTLLTPSSEMKYQISDEIKDMLKGQFHHSPVLRTYRQYAGFFKYTSLSLDNLYEGVTHVLKLPNGRVDLQALKPALAFHLTGRKESQWYSIFRDQANEMATKRRKYRENGVRELVENVNILLEKEDTGTIFKTFRDKFIKNAASRVNLSTMNMGVDAFYDHFASACEDIEEMYAKERSDEEKQAYSDDIEYIRKYAKLDATVLYGNKRSLNTEVEDDNDNGVIDLTQLPELKDDKLFLCTALLMLTPLRVTGMQSDMYHFNKLINNSGKVAEEDNANKNSDDMWLISLLAYPYAHAFFSVGISMKAADAIYGAFSLNLFGINVAEKNKEYRRHAEFMTHIPETLETVSSLSSGRRHREYTKEIPCNKWQISVLKHIFTTVELDDDIAKAIAGDNWYSEEEMQSMVDAGTIVNYKPANQTPRLMLASSYEKQLVVYHVFQQLGLLHTDIVDQDIMIQISRFEELKKFKLEKLQKDAIYLTKNRAGILSGCAGSGKTTVSECILRVLESKGYEVRFCAPTGKAGRRLAEVVHRPVRTIHSEFRIDPNPKGWFEDVADGIFNTDSDKHIAYILDEMAMASTDILYEVAIHLSKGDCCYILGDYRQLPPIIEDSFGRSNTSPFIDLMNVIPCVELGVSKRVANGSLLDYDAALINYVSDLNGNYESLKYDEETVLDVHCNDSELLNKTRQVFKELMTGELTGMKYREGDIQVVTPFATTRRVSSSVKLSTGIQMDLRKNDVYVLSTRDDEMRLYQKDRVIRTGDNDYQMCRYAMVERDDGLVEFTPMYTCGTTKGEMGRVVGKVPTEKCIVNHFNEEEAYKYAQKYKKTDKEIDNLREEHDRYKENLREDWRYKGKNKYFLIIESYDPELNHNVYLLYRFRSLRGKNDNLTDLGNQAVHATKTDIGNLSLGCAITCHKMQGSQAKAVIVVLESTNETESFVNRNLLYTMMTRAENVVVFVGQTKDTETLGIARRKEENWGKDILTILSRNQ